MRLIEVPAWKPVHSRLEPRHVASIEELARVPAHILSPDARRCSQSGASASEPDDTEPLDGGLSSLVPQATKHLLVDGSGRSRCSAADEADSSDPLVGSALTVEQAPVLLRPSMLGHIFNMGRGEGGLPGEPLPIVNSKEGLKSALTPLGHEDGLGRMEAQQLEETVDLSGLQGGMGCEAGPLAPSPKLDQTANPSPSLPGGGVEIIQTPNGPRAGESETSPVAEYDIGNDLGGLASVVPALDRPSMVGDEAVPQHQLMVATAPALEDVELGIDLEGLASVNLELMRMPMNNDEDTPLDQQLITTTVAPREDGFGADLGGFASVNSKPAAPSQAQCTDSAVAEGSSGAALTPVKNGTGTNSAHQC